MKRNIKIIFSSIGILLMAFIFTLIFGACANIARPEGGPKDETPPKYVRSVPTPEQLNVSKRKIEIEFDELIQLEKPMEKIVISPPQKEMPVIKSSGRKVIIELKDTLQPNSTYTIDFSDAVVDNNEKNILNGFSLSFATGSYIDSLQMSGMIFNARDLEPVTGILVGAHTQLSDSAFITDPFKRIASSDIYGHFTIQNLAPRNYRIYGLKDLNRDYRFDNPTEDIAFEDSIRIPSFEITTVNDTVWKDSVTVDTVTQRQLTVFHPNNLVLFAFNEEFKNQYLEKFERKDRRSLQLFFSAPADSLPVMRPLNFSPPKDWALTEYSVNKDTVTYWIKDSTLYNIDTLQFVAGYQRTDSLRKLVPYDDTLKFIYREIKVPVKKKKRKDDEPEVIPIEFLKQKNTLASTLNIYAKPSFVFDEPVDSLRKDGLRLEMKVDTTWKEIPFRFERDSIAIRTYRLQNKWKPGMEYRFSIDSTAITSIYGHYTDKYTQTFTTKKLEEYSNLYFSTIGVPDSAFVELLNSSDAIVRTARVKKGGAEFMYIDPGTYYARIVIDRNGNGKYDTGNYARKQQPERVYYYPKSVVLKANWDVEQDWDVFGTPIEKQKPRALIKNKPKGEQTQEEKPEEETGSPFSGNSNR